MKYFISVLLCLLCACSPKVPKGIWQVQNLPINTPWTAKVSPENTHSEYPRPQMQRSHWKSLNGLWEYAIIDKEKTQMKSAQGEILVPFPVESALSGVQDTVAMNERLWYRRTIQIPEDWSGERVLLHFEAVDWEMIAWLDNEQIGTHRGGYDPFTFDISEYCSAGQNHTLTIAVWDPSNSGSNDVQTGTYYNPHGKQVRNPGGIFYTSTTGIWQSVWLEAVPQTYIQDFHYSTDIQSGTVKVTPEIFEAKENDKIVAIISKGGKDITRQVVNTGDSISMTLNNPRPWSPDDPFLYDLEIQLMRADSIVDKVESYLGLRSIELVKDPSGVLRIALNDKFEFQNGPLDQGFWPDGIYTPPTDEALKYDLEVIKSMGFNMLRKHVKVESRRFYYWCDVLGLWVWQDMPSTQPFISPDEADLQLGEEHVQNFETELKNMVMSHRNHPSIVVWVPFNEGWGQHKSAEITQKVKEWDPTRLVITTSGWSDRGTGDIFDIHNYPEPRMPELYANRASVLGEFGGLGYSIQDHLWTSDNWGYSQFQNVETLSAEYEKYYQQIWQYKQDGLSACVYTQITDVETEVNGLMTYDRKVIKMDTSFLKGINTNNFVPAPSLSNTDSYIYAPIDISIKSEPGNEIYYTIDGSEPDSSSSRYTRSFIVQPNSTLRAVAISAAGKSSRVISHTWSKSDFLPPEYVEEYSNRYKAVGKFALVDGEKGSINFRDGKWQGFQGDTLEVIFQFAEPRKVSKLNMNFLQDQGAWIFLPGRIEAWAVDYAGDFMPLGEKVFEVKEDEERKIEQVSFNVNDDQEVSQIKVRAENVGIGPEWHPGKGRPVWLFIDEVEMD